MPYKRRISAARSLSAGVVCAQPGIPGAARISGGTGLSDLASYLSGISFTPSSETIDPNYAGFARLRFGLGNVWMIACVSIAERHSRFANCSARETAGQARLLTALPAREAQQARILRSGTGRTSALGYRIFELTCTAWSMSRIPNSWREKPEPDVRIHKS